MDKIFDFVVRIVTLLVSVFEKISAWKKSRKEKKQEKKDAEEAAKAEK